MNAATSIQRGSRSLFERRIARLWALTALLVLILVFAGCQPDDYLASETDQGAVVALPTTPAFSSEKMTGAVEAIAPDPAPEGVPLKQRLRFSHLTTEDGLSEGRVWDITQDSRGFLWFTSLDGLNRYDGYEFKIYRQETGNPNSPGGNGFFTVYEDRQGLIWVGSPIGGGLSSFDPTTEQWTRYQYDAGDPASLSSNNVWAITEDKFGVLWIGTENGGLNAFDPQKTSFTRYLPDPDDPHNLTPDFIHSIHADQVGILWIGTVNDGFYRLDPQMGTFTRYQHDPEDANSLSHNYVQAIYEDQSGELWVGTYGGGINRFDRQAETFVRYQHDPDNPDSLSGNMVSDILEDQSGTLWIATFDGGLNRYSPEQDSFISYQNDAFDPNSLSSSTLASLFVDRSGILWIGTSGAGISKLDPNAQGFTLFQHNPADANGLSNNDVRSVFEDRFGDLWIGTSGGLDRYDPRTGRFTHYRHDPNDPTSLGNDHVLSIGEDSAGAVWVGVYTQGLDRYDRDTDTFSHYRPDPADPNSVSDGIITALYLDQEGTQWIGTVSEGLDALNLQQRDGQARFTHYRHDPEDQKSLGEGIVYAILEDRAGDLWVGTAGGGLNRFDRESGTFRRYLHDPEDADSLGDNTVFGLYEDREGSLWIGTSSGLSRLDPRTGKFTQYTTADGLAHNTVYGMLEDEQAHLWLSTARGLSRFDPSTRTFQTYTASDGLQGDVFNPVAFVKTSTGELFFGGQNGMTGFFPDDIRENPHVPQVHVISVQLADESVGIGDDSLLQTSILDTEEIALSYVDRIISFEFSALSYNAPDKNRYRYKLEGFEEGWHEVDSSRRFATYTNLNSGDYTFRVIASNNDGVWNEEGASLKLTITPPWWETIWFRGGMLALIVGVFSGVFFLRVSVVERQKRQLEAEVTNRTQELVVAKEEAETANLAKSSFLASMSHELRTPLNAILGFTRLMARTPGVSSQQEEMLDVINRSGEHLLAMVNDVLSLSQIEAGRVELRLEAFDIVRFLEDIGMLVKPRAEVKGLQFFLDLDPHLPHYVLGDAAKIHQVLINLLGNAVKFTEAGQVRLQVTSKWIADAPTMVTLHFEVEDSGPGIPQEEQDEIFARFTQIEQPSSTERGAGLGLAISRSLVALMGGEIGVESEPGTGSRFMVELPIALADASAAAPVAAPAVVSRLQDGQPDWRILVVDDNTDNRLLLTSLLTQVGFTVQEATNGQEAVAHFQAWHPHFIWMDIRMPVLDGIAATEQIRALPGGETIKIVAITASVLQEQREGILAAGCDDVVNKPIQEPEIFAAMAQFLGVDYVYAEENPRLTETQRPALTAAMLADLPEKRLADLKATTLSLDLEGTQQVIDQIQDQHPDVAAGLRDLVQNFQMGRIQALLVETEAENGY